MKKNFFKIIAIIVFAFFLKKNQLLSRTISKTDISADYYTKTSKPYTRWWWFADTIKEKDIKHQLDWLKENNFGGVEIAWIYPYNRRDTTIKRFPKQEWLSQEWTDIVTYTKQYADQIGLGCDFTFGTGWPFGDSFVTKEEAFISYQSDNVKEDPEYQRNFYTLSWEFPQKGYIINHLDKSALESYSRRLGRALLPALKGSPSALFCDSWEVPSMRPWRDGFEKEFESVFGYSILPYMDSILEDTHKDYRYDYMKLVSKHVIEDFYKPFTEEAHKLGAFTRVQCGGAPTDLMTAFSYVDVPETEAMLFNPDFSRIVASAAALSSKKVVSSETFTCVYGFPAQFQFEEQTADLKLVVDALFANGTNQIFWHGMPFNKVNEIDKRFFATTHVGKKGRLTNELKDFNSYMEKVANVMKKGHTYSNLAVYIPMEDAWMKGPLPEELQIPGSWNYYELRFIEMNPELKGYNPLWINYEFLKKGKIINKKLVINNQEIALLYVDVEYLDINSLSLILDYAKQGLPVCIKKTPKQPGKNKQDNYPILLETLRKLPNVSDNFFKIIKAKPIIQGKELPEYWCRKDGNEYYIFFANPLSSNLKYPLKYGQSFNETTITKNITMNFGQKPINYSLVFKPYQSILLKVSNNKVETIDITFNPQKPIVK